jgi:hypothetical protein
MMMGEVALISESLSIAILYQRPVRLWKTLPSYTVSDNLHIQAVHGHVGQPGQLCLDIILLFPPP